MSKLTPLHVDYVTYMDDIAGEVGVRPSLLWLFFTDYSLFQWVLWGPLTAYQYRLKGSIREMGGSPRGDLHPVRPHVPALKDEKGRKLFFEILIGPLFEIR